MSFPSRFHNAMDRARESLERARDQAGIIHDEYMKDQKRIATLVYDVAMKEAYQRYAQAFQEAALEQDQGHEIEVNDQKYIDMMLSARMTRNGYVLNNYILAIKQYRNDTGAGLKDAKDYIDRLVQENHIKKN